MSNSSITHKFPPIVCSFSSTIADSITVEVPLARCPRRTYAFSVISRDERPRAMDAVRSPASSSTIVANVRLRIWGVSPSNVSEVRPRLGHQINTLPPAMMRKWEGILLLSFLVLSHRSNCTGLPTPIAIVNVDRVIKGLRYQLRGEYFMHITCGQHATVFDEHRVRGCLR